MEFGKLKAGLDLGSELLRVAFKGRWLKLKGADWQGAVSGSEFLQKHVGARCKLLSAQKKQLKQGQVEAWDPSLLSCLLMDADWPPFADSKTSTDSFCSAVSHFSKSLRQMNKWRWKTEP